MDLLSFIGALLVIVLLGWLATFLFGQLGGPISAVAVKAVYVVCVIFIVLLLLNALGLGHNVQIPRLFH